MPLESSINKTSLRKEASIILQKTPTLSQGHILRGISLAGNPYYHGKTLIDNLIFDFILLKKIKNLNRDKNISNSLYVLFGDTLHISNIAYQNNINIHEIADHMDTLTELAIDNFNHWWNSNKNFILDALKVYYHEQIDINQLNNLLNDSEPFAEQQISTLNQLLAEKQINIKFFTWKKWNDFVKQNTAIDKLTIIDKQHKDLYQTDRDYQAAYQRTATEFVSRQQKIKNQLTNITNNEKSSKLLNSDNNDIQAFEASLHYLRAEAPILLAYAESVGCSGIIYAGQITEALSITCKRMRLSLSWIDSSGIKPIQHINTFESDAFNFQYNIIKLSQIFDLNNSEQKEFFIKLLSLLLHLSINVLCSPKIFMNNIQNLVSELQNLSKNLSTLPATKLTSKPIQRIKSVININRSISADNNDKKTSTTLPPTNRPSELLSPFSSHSSEYKAIGKNNSDSVIESVANHPPTLQTSTITAHYSKQVDLFINLIKKTFPNNTHKLKFEDEKEKFIKMLFNFYDYIVTTKIAASVLANMLKKTFSNIILLDNHSTQQALAEIAPEILKIFNIKISENAKNIFNKLIIEAFKRYLPETNIDEKTEVLQALVNDLIFEGHNDSKEKAVALKALLDFLEPISAKQRVLQQQIDGALKKYIFEKDSQLKKSIIERLNKQLINKKNLHDTQKKDELSNKIDFLFNLPLQPTDNTEIKKSLLRFIQEKFNKISTTNITAITPCLHDLQYYLKKLGDELISPWYQIGFTIKKLSSFFDKTNNTEQELFTKILSAILISSIASHIKYLPDFLRRHIYQLKLLLSPATKGEIPANPIQVSVLFNEYSESQNYIPNEQDISELLKQAAVSLPNLIAEKNLLSTKIIELIYITSNISISIDLLALSIQEASHIIYANNPASKINFLEKISSYLQDFLNNKKIINIDRNSPKSRAYPNSAIYSNLTPTKGTEEDKPSADSNSLNLPHSKPISPTSP